MRHLGPHFALYLSMMKNRLVPKSIFIVSAVIATLLVAESGSVLAKNTYYSKREPSADIMDEACVSCIFEQVPQKVFKMSKDALNLAKRFASQVVDPIQEYSPSRLAYIERINNMMNWNSCEKFYNRENGNWSKEIVGQFIVERFTSLSNLNPSINADAIQDVRAFCPRYDHMNSIDRGFVWALIMNAVSKFESNCNPNVRVQGVNGIAAGLLQLDFGKEKQYINSYIRIAKMEDQVGDETRDKCNRNISHDAVSSLRCGMTMISSLIGARTVKKDAYDQSRDLKIISGSALQMQRVSHSYWSKHPQKENDPYVKYLSQYEPVYYNYVWNRLEKARMSGKLSPGLYDRGSYWEVLRPNVKPGLLKQVLLALSAYEPCLRKMGPKEMPNSSLFDAKNEFVKAKRTDLTDSYRL